MPQATACPPIVLEMLDLQHKFLTLDRRTLRGDKKEEAIRSVRKFGSVIETVGRQYQNYLGDPEVLATCQKLCDEMKRVLIAKKTVKVTKVAKKKR